MTNPMSLAPRDTMQKRDGRDGDCASNGPDLRVGARRVGSVRKADTRMRCEALRVLIFLVG